MRVGTVGGLAGIAIAFATNRLTKEQAMREIHDLLARVPEHERQVALDDAAATYIGPGLWHDQALQILLSAGADRTAAEAIRAQRPGNDLGKIGERAAPATPAPRP